MDKLELFLGRNDLLTTVNPNDPRWNFDPITHVGLKPIFMDESYGQAI